MGMFLSGSPPGQVNWLQAVGGERERTDSGVHDEPCRSWRNLWEGAVVQYPNFSIAIQPFGVTNFIVLCGVALWRFTVACLPGIFLWDGGMDEVVAF